MDKSEGRKRDPKTGKIYYERDGEMEAKPIPVKFEKRVGVILRSLPNRSEFIRQAVNEKLNRDGIGQQDQAGE